MNRSYTVLVGNIGLVHTGHDLKQADAVFDDYRDQSEKGIGRAAGEPVTLCRDGEPIREFLIPEPT